MIICITLTYYYKNLNIKNKLLKITAIAASMFGVTQFGDRNEMQEDIQNQLPKHEENKNFNKPKSFEEREINHRDLKEAIRIINDVKQEKKYPSAFKDEFGVSISKFLLEYYLICGGISQHLRCNWLGCKHQPGTATIASY